MVVEGERLADRKPLSAARQKVADRRARETEQRALLCRAILVKIGREIRLGDLMSEKIHGKYLSGVNMKLRFWPEFKHLIREWRGRKMWIVNKKEKE